MNANEYADWCRYAGVYTGNASNGDEFRSYEKKLSPAGLAVMVVHTFLRQNRDGVDIAGWRNFYVAGSKADVEIQLKQTVAALRAIGADQAAQLVANSTDTSLLGQLETFFDQPTGQKTQSLDDITGSINPADLMNELRQNIARVMPDEAAKAGIDPPDPPPAASGNCETRDQMASLLQLFIDDHIDELNGDIARYGDVREQIDFDPQQRKEELEQQRRRELQAELQEEDAAKIANLIETFHTRRSQQPNAGAEVFHQIRRELHELFARYRDRIDTIGSAALKAALAELKDLYAAHESIFFLKPVENETLLQRMAAIGEYDCDDEYGATVVTWRKPRGLNSAFKPLALRIVAEERNEATFQLLLAAAERACDKAPSLSETIRNDLIASFREAILYGPDWMFEDFPRDASGVVAESTILGATGGGTLEIELVDEDSSNVSATVWLSVDWDDEHGFETRVDLNE